MKITITKQIEESKEIEIPAFFKNGSDYYALLHEKTLLNVYVSDDLVIMKDTLPTYDSNFGNGFKNLQPSTEDEFFAAWEKAYKRLNMMPVLSAAQCYREDQAYDNRPDTELTGQQTEWENKL